MSDEQEKSELTDRPAPAAVPVEPVQGDIVPAATEIFADTQTEPEPMVRMTLGEHLEDLRRRLFYAAGGLCAATCIGLVFGKTLLRWIIGPFDAAMIEAGKAQAALNATELTAPFYMYLKISLYAGLVLACPWIFYHLWMFVAAGLYRKERRYVKLAMPASVFLFLLGAWFAVWLSVPAMKFFIQFGDSLGIHELITLQDYVSFMTNLVLAFGVVFQMPLVVLVLAKVGILDMKKLQHYRRHVIVICAALAAFLAPPDLFSMIAMLVPMWLLYEFGIFLAWLLVFRKKTAAEEAA